MITRIISAFAGIIIGITVLFLSDTIVFSAAIAAISVIIVYELLNTCKCIQFKVHSAFCFAFAAVSPFIAQYGNIKLMYTLGAACVFGMFTAYILEHKRIVFDKLCFMIAASLLATISMCCLITLKNLSSVHGVCYIVLALAGAWLGDSGAYFVGTFFGKHKLCPEISPKKTIEGAVGGIVTTGVIFGIYGFFYHMFQTSRGIEFEVNYIALILIGMFCAVIGMIGDLSASLIKRQNDIKDFGKIMPGHGGLMDRFDSVLFVVPFMAILLSYLSIFN
jgi:phosphatidate cytidylyltransferase